METEYLSTRAELALMEKTCAITYLCVKHDSLKLEMPRGRGDLVQSHAVLRTTAADDRCRICTPLLRGARRGKVVRGRSEPELRPCRDPLRRFPD